VGAHPNDHCSIQQTLDQVGDRWTLLVLRDIFRGYHRFSHIQADLGIARNLLADRLARLVDVDILTKVPYSERPPRFEYRLTPKGRELSVPLVALMHWGDHWCADDRPPVLLVHHECGTPLDVAITCPTCDDEVAAPDIRSLPGPGRTMENQASPGPGRTMENQATA
jgi:DNA-binding HxlR family transcriptional regulator